MSTFSFIKKKKKHSTQQNNLIIIIIFISVAGFNKQFHLKLGRKKKRILKNKINCIDLVVFTKLRDSRIDDRNSDSHIAF